MSRVRLLILILLALPSIADDLILSVRDVPAHGIVTGNIDFTAAAHWCGAEALQPSALRAWLLPARRPVPIQFVPAADFNGRSHISGLLILKVPGDGDLAISWNGGPTQSPAFAGKVSTASYRVTHAPEKGGGLPSRIEFLKSGQDFRAFRFNDRLYDPDLGSFSVSADTAADVEQISEGPLATVIRVRARYGPKAHPSGPGVVYDWCYLQDLPLVWVTATASQDPVHAWKETHFLELSFHEEFPVWAGGEPFKQGNFTGATRSVSCSDWGAIIAGQDAIAMLDCGRVLFYDSPGGNYLQAHGDKAWKPWESHKQQWSSWLWIGSSEAPVDAIRSAGKSLPNRGQLTLKLASLQSAIKGLKGKWPAATAAQQLASQGRFQETSEIIRGTWPANLSTAVAGDLGLMMEQRDSGIGLLSLSDIKTGQEFVSEDSGLFKLTVRHAETKEKVALTAREGWSEVAVHRTPSGLDLHWSRPIDQRLAGLRVHAKAIATDAGFNWELDANSANADWGLWRVVYPRVSLAEPGADPQLFLPRASGQVEADVWRREFESKGDYPSGWTTMQYVAAYGAEAGLYLGVHDPYGGTKEIRARSDAERRQLTLAFDHPVADMGSPGNTFHGEASWQLFRGDWFDAARIYRRWVHAHAKWFPRQERAIPDWMRQLSAWSVGGGDPKTGLPLHQRFANEMGEPTGFHWYNWHQIPFDNDYPHYFPADPGFADAVKTLQAANIRVMPYINGRLWDTRDKGAEDHEFSKLALAAASKDEQGAPYLETYSSKESDGSKVALAAMCPHTSLWQDKVRSIVLRLFEEGVDAVYIDQVAAAKPRLCFDPSHGHPLGGGHWWTEAYWKMLEQIRAEMPPGRVLTSECNAEPYMKYFDGYLTWHWQHDGQVPAFSAVYSDAIRLFGRAYRGGPSKDLALRMKAAQQLVFGEQIGWISPAVVKEPENLAFLREIVAIRSEHRRYFDRGQMARPPRLSGKIPRVTADWQWRGEWPVTTDACLTGAWQLPEEKKTLILLVNVSEQTIETTLKLEAAEYGVDAEYAVKLAPHSVTAREF